MFKRSLRSSVLLAALLIAFLVSLAAAQNAARRNAQQQDAFQQLVSGKGRALLSQPVTLAQVAIQNITQEDIIWVGDSGDHSVMVMLRPSVNPIDAHGNPTPIAPGDAVRVTGHVVRAPSAQVLQSWGVTPADAARVQQQGVVLQAVTFEVIKRIS